RRRSAAGAGWHGLAGQSHRGLLKAAPLLQLRVSGENTRLNGLATWLENSGQARNTVLLPAVHNVHYGHLYADMESDAATAVLTYLDQNGVPADHIAVLRTEDIGPAIPRGRDSSLVWVDMVDLARRNARPLARYVVFMIVAGIIAGYGVITVNSTLIV